MFHWELLSTIVLVCFYDTRILFFQHALQKKTVTPQNTPSWTVKMTPDIVTTADASALTSAAVATSVEVDSPANKQPASLFTHCYSVTVLEWTKNKKNENKYNRVLDCVSILYWEDRWSHWLPNRDNNLINTLECIPKHASVESNRNTSMLTKMNYKMTCACINASLK